MNFEIENIYEPVTVHFEFAVTVGDFSYLVIYGRHVNGYFCAIPNWNWCCELGEPNSIFYNAEKLMNCCGANKEVAESLAKSIRHMAHQNLENTNG